MQPIHSASPSPSSSTSSFASYFDPARLAIGHGNFDRRKSESSATSWGSAGEPTKSPGSDDIMMEDASRLPPGTYPIDPASSSSSSSSSPFLSTPDIQSEQDRLPFGLPTQPLSPSSSTTSTTPSKGERTPRAELSQPHWPLITAPSPTRPHEQTESVGQLGETTSAAVRRASLKRTGSWRRKHASLDTPPTAPHLDSAFPGFTTLNRAPPVGQSASAPPLERSKLGPPAIDTTFDSRRSSNESHRSTGSNNSMVAQSPTTGCEISAPKAPPAGYPLPSSVGWPRGSPMPDPTPTSSTSMSSSSSSKSAPSVSTPPPPKWACPPTRTNAVSGRALSFGSGQERPDVSFDDFDSELFEGDQNEWIEIIKGAEGRIAIKSTPALYDIMVWLPGFSLDNITIATRGHRTIHIVADQWDEADHAQWDIKLGEDANLKSVNAKFTGKELRVTVAREQRYGGFRSRPMPTSSRPPMMAQYSSPSITSTAGHDPLERATLA
ncbi:hypothetical protein IAU60_003558 [Kwoniella sp. DSM 27419]